MNFERLKEMNQKLPTTNIKGKEYVEVNNRILAFRELYPEGAIETEIIEMKDGICTIKATIKDGERIISTGMAQEKETSSFINKTSYVENCETSAIGRALGILGIGINNSIASAEEVDNAIHNQEKIDKIHKEALESAIKNNGITDEEVEKVLSQFGFGSTAEITNGKYTEIVNEFKKMMRKKE